MPTRHLDSGVCAVCGNKLLVQENEEGVLENTYKLSCDHVYPLNKWCIGECVDIIMRSSVNTIINFLDMIHCPKIGTGSID
jgi:hypothetical protein